MAWSEVLDEENFSVGIAVQTDVNTAGSSWTWIDCEMPQVTFDAAQTDTKRSRRARGAGTKRLTGKVWPRVAVRFPMCGQLAAYAYASDTPALQAQNLLLDWLGGSSAIAYQAAGMSPTDGDTVSLITSTGKLGCLIAGRESTGVVNAMGFCKSLSGAGPFVCNMRDDMKAQPGTTIGRLATVTKYPSSTAPSAITIRVTGEHANQEKRYLGCYLVKATMTFDADWRPYWNCEFIAYGGEVRGTSGGLQTVTECLPLEPLVQRGGARFVIGSNVITTLVDGTVDADGTCDVRDFSLSWDFTHYVATKPTGNEGVKEVVVRSPTLSASFCLPDITDFEVSSAQMGEAAWRNATELSVSLYLGDTPGQLFACSLPRMGMTAFPGVKFIEGVRHREYNLEARNNTADGASTDAGNKPASFSWG